jgi:hypothetical protein
MTIKLKIAKQTKRHFFPRCAERFSLSLRERAGVRGNVVPKTSER